MLKHDRNKVTIELKDYQLNEMYLVKDYFNYATLEDALEEILEQGIVAVENKIYKE